MMAQSKSEIVRIAVQILGVVALVWYGMRDYVHTRIELHNQIAMHAGAATKFEKIDEEIATNVKDIQTVKTNVAVLQAKGEQ